ncbi:MAG: TniB family NTP-binding protein [Burkholderiaceae bacterium]
MTTIDFDVQFSKLDDVLISHKAFDYAQNRLKRVAEFAKRYTDPEVAILLGESRAGKTRLLEIIEQQWPPYRTDEQAFMPILRIKISRKPTVKGVITQLLHKLGDPLYEKRGTETIKTIALIGFLKKMKVRVIMLDEFQHFVSHRGQIDFEVADLFKLLADEARVSIVLAGLPSARGVIDANEQLAGRALRPLYLPRFNWNLASSREEFKLILKGFSDALKPISTPDFNNDEWGFRWYCATGGMIGYISKIFREALNQAAIDKKTSITIEDLGRAHFATVYVPNAVGVRPFDAGFAPIPTPEAMALAATVGVRSEITDTKEKVRKNSTNQKEKSSPSSNYKI